MPESPVWLIQNGHLNRAQASLKWLRSDPRLVKSEYQDLLQRNEASKQKVQQNESLWTICKQSSVLKPMVITYTYRVMGVLCGSLLTIFYYMNILKDLEIEAFVDLGKIVVYTGSVRLIFCIFQCVLLSVISRRIFIISTSIGSGVSVTVLAIFLYCRHGKQHTTLDYYVSATCLFIYFACVSAFFLMTLVIAGELLPARVRGRLGGYNMAAFSFINFIAAKVFLDLLEYIKVYGIFTIFAVASFGAAIVMFLQLPETKGKTLGEIEDYFQNEKWLWMSRSKYNKRNEKN